MRLRWVAVGMGVAAAMFFAAASAEDWPVPRSPALPDLARRLVSLQDSTGATGGLEFSDLVRVDLARDANDWIFQAQFAREFADGMFTVLVTEWDCDGRRSDTELWTRAAVGSRFRPSAYFPRAGERAPIDLLRGSWASPFDERAPVPLNSSRRNTTHWGALTSPTIGASRIEFRVPAELVNSHGARGATSPPGFRLSATTTCSEHPVVFDYDASDLGRDIRVDGTVSEWSGGPYAEDGKGELHPVLSHLDIVAVWCEHGSDRIFVRVDFAAPGFGRIPSSGGDVFVTDALHVSIEPLGFAYMDPIRIEIPATAAAGEVSSDTMGSGPRVRARYACGTSSVEISIPRKAEQTRVRVAVWTDAERTDSLGSGWIVLPPGDGR